MQSKLIQILIVVALVAGAFLLGNAIRDDDTARQQSTREGAETASYNNTARGAPRSDPADSRARGPDGAALAGGVDKPQGKAAVTADAAKAKLQPGQKLGVGIGDDAEEIFLDDIRWDKIQAAFRLRANQPDNQTPEEAEAYGRLRMSNGMQAMGELMRIIDEYGLDMRRPNVRGRGRVLTRMISLSLPDTRATLTAEETTMLRDSAATYAAEEQRVEAMGEATLVMRGAALKQADLRQLTSIAGRLAADADLAVVASVVTQMHHKVPFTTHPNRDAARAAMASRLASASDLDETQRSAAVPLLERYLAAVARIPSELAGLYPADVVGNLYVAARATPYAYHPGGQPRIPMDWTQQQKRQGLLAHVDCEARFLNAEAKLHEALRPLLRPEQWNKLVELEPNYVVAQTDQPGAR